MNTRIDFERIPGPVLDVCRTLGRAGHQAYLVGGGVRDLLMDAPVHDWDVATSAKPEQVQALFRRTLPIGLKHGTVVVMATRELAVEVTTYRGEGTYSDGRHPDSVTFVSSLEQDLERRDFTINAMALDPLRRTLADPQNGRDDLKRRLIRAVGDPVHRFTEDGLRVMRGVRFSALLGFAVHHDTENAMARCAGNLARVSWERIRDELLKLLGAPKPSDGLRLMQRTGLLGRVLPELTAGAGLHQNRHHPDDVFDHSLAVCDAVPPGDPLLRLAALLHDVGKPPCAAPHADDPSVNTFHAHEAEGARLCDAIGQRLKLSTAQRRRVCHLVAQHMFPEKGLSSAGLRRLLRRVGPEHIEDLWALKRADIASKNGAEQRLVDLDALGERLDQVQNETPPLSTSQLAVNGRQLMQRLAITPGPLVGRIMRHLLEKVTDDPQLNDLELLIKLAKDFASVETSNHE